MTDTTIITAAAKNLSRSYYVCPFLLGRYAQEVSQSQVGGNEDEWGALGADYLDYEPGEEEDWAADHVAHFQLSLFVIFVAREWAGEYALAIATSQSRGDGLKGLIEKATAAFVAAWADAREGR